MVCVNCGDDNLGPRDFPTRKYTRKDGTVVIYANSPCRRCRRNYERARRTRCDYLGQTMIGLALQAMAGSREQGIGNRE